MEDKFITTIGFDAAADAVYDFNLRMGKNVDNPTWADIFAQNKINFEEQKELYYALRMLEEQQAGKVTQEQLGDYNPLIEVVDAVGDTTVTAPMLVTMIEGKGIDVQEAFDRIMENNELKLYDNRAEADYECQRFVDKTSIVAGVVAYTDPEGVTWYSVRDGEGKVRKSIDHPTVDLSDLVEDIKGE